MVKTCSHGLCNSSDLYASEAYMDGVRFIPFPKPATQPEKCRRWVKACNRVGFTISSVTRSTYICSKHFPGGFGPTEDFPDPITAHISQYSHIGNKTRKRLHPSTDSDRHQTDPCETILEILYEDVSDPESRASEQARIVILESPETSSQGTHYTDTRSAPEMYHSFSDSNQINEGSSVSADKSPRKLYNEIISVGIPQNWACYCENNELIFIKFQKQIPVIFLKLNFQFRLKLTILGEEVSEKHQILNFLMLEGVTSVQDLLYNLNTLNKWKVCEGTKDQMLTDECVNIASSRNCKIMKHRMYLPLHSKTCELIFPFKEQQNACAKCRILKSCLASAAYRKKMKSCFPTKKYSKRCNTRYLPPEEVRRQLKVLSEVAIEGEVLLTLEAISNCNRKHLKNKCRINAGLGTQK